MQDQRLTYLKSIARSAWFRDACIELHCMTQTPWPERFMNAADTFMQHGLEMEALNGRTVGITFHGDRRRRPDFIVIHSGAYPGEYEAVSMMNAGQYSIGVVEGGRYVMEGASQAATNRAAA